MISRMSWDPKGSQLILGSGKFRRWSFFSLRAVAAAQSAVSCGANFGIFRKMCGGPRDARPKHLIASMCISRGAHLGIFRKSILRAARRALKASDCFNHVRVEK